MHFQSLQRGVHATHLLNASASVQGGVGVAEFEHALICALLEDLLTDPSLSADDDAYVALCKALVYEDTNTVVRTAIEDFCL
jgi:hypothetical protein